MHDTTFVSLLNSQAALDRCITGVGFEGGIAAPTYQRRFNDISVRIVPAAEGRYQSILGEQAQVSHVGFVLGDCGMSSAHPDEVPVSAGDVLVWKVETTHLTADVEAGAAEVPVYDPTVFEAGWLVELGEGAVREQATVEETSGESIILAAALEGAHIKGEPAILVRRFEVLHVRFWPGLEHHLELALQEIEL